MGEKQMEGAGGRDFPPNRILYPQSGLHPPLHQQPWLRNSSANSTHTDTHSSCQKSFDSNQQSTFLHHTKPMRSVDTGNCLKSNTESLKSVSSNYSQNELPLKPFSMRGQDNT